MLNRLWTVICIVPAFLLLMISAIVVFPLVYVITGKNMFEKDPMYYIVLFLEKMGCNKL